MEIGHRRASKSSTDAQASLSGFSYPDVRFQAIKWVIIVDLWYNILDQACSAASISTATVFQVLRCGLASAIRCRSSSR